MEDIKLLRGDDLVINDALVFKHLTINNVVDFTEINGEENYFSIINLFIVRPYEMMDILYDSGIDYEEMTEYELFISLFRTGTYNEFLQLLIGNLEFKVCADTEKNEIVLYDSLNDVIIDEKIYYQIKEFIMKIHHIHLKETYKAGNETIKKFRIKQKRAERKKHQNDKFKSQLLDLVTAIMVGTNGAVTYFNVWDMPIYPAFTALNTTLKLQNFSNTMLGVYTGNISLRDVPKETLDWTSNE